MNHGLQELALFALLLLAGAASIGACTSGPEGRIGATCERDSECETGRCDELVCKRAKPLPQNQECTHDFDCASEKCIRIEGDRRCSPYGVRPPGAACTVNSQCASGWCFSGSCRATEDQRPRDSGAPGGDGAMEDGLTPADGTTHDDRPRDGGVDGATADSNTRPTALPSDHFIYRRSWLIRPVGIQMRDVHPHVVGNLHSFSVSPTLPAGLVLDSGTGVISGTPSAIQPGTDHTISAIGAQGAVEFVLHVKTLAAYVVNATLDEPAAAPASNNTCSSTPSGLCTLRAAIEEASATAGVQLVYLPDNIYYLESSLGTLMPTGDLYLVGESRSGTAIDGNDAVRILDHVDDEIWVSDLTIQNAKVSGDGAGIRFARNTAYLSNIHLFSNEVVGGLSDAGGGYIRDGSLFLEHSLIQDNVGVYAEAAFWISKTTAEFNYVTFEGNRAHGIIGAMSFQGGDLLMENCIYKNNSAGGSQGALAIASSTATLKNVSFYKNRAGRGSGGALSIHGGEVRIYNSSFLANEAPTGGGMWVDSKATIYLYNTLLDNVGTASVANCLFMAGTTIVQGSNLETADDCGFTGGSSREDVPAEELGAQAPTLANGIVESIGISERSVAIDNADNSFCPSHDARGYSRTTDRQGNPLRCDIGAVERY